MTRTIAPALLVLLPLAAAAAQDEPEIVVEVSQEQVYEGQSVAYQVTLNHVENPSPPELQGFDDFEVQSLGEQSLDSTQITVINGRMTKIVRRGRQYRYRLTPRKTGLLRIPGPTAKVNGRLLQGPERVLRVIPAEEQDTVFMEIRADRQSVYPMQPFTVTLTVAVKDLPGDYSGNNPMAVQRQPPALRIPWAIDGDLPDGLQPVLQWQNWLGRLQDRQGHGFSVNNVGQPSVFSLFDDRAMAFQPEPQRVTRHDTSGRAAGYWQYDFSRTFTPKKVGTYRFGPATLEGTFAARVDAGGRLLGDEIYAVARQIQLTVKDVPLQGRPDTYVGAAGRFQLGADLAPKKAKVGDPMTLTLTLTGEGTLESAFAPDLADVPEIADKFKIYEASEEARGSSCRFTYGLRPLEEGIEEFPSVPVSYFDVESERYVTLRTDPIPIEVVRAERLSDDQIVATPGGSSARRRQLEVRREGIFANLTDLSAVRDESVHAARWLLGLGGMAGLYAAVALVTTQVRRRSADKALLRRRGAAGKARRRLRQATAELDAGQIHQGADLVQDALAGLVADVAGLHEVGLTPKDVCAKLQTLGVEEDLVRRVGSLLETCDATRYGSANQADGLGHQAQEVFEELVLSLKAKKRFR